MTQTKKAKGYVVELFLAHQDKLDSHLYKTYEDALQVLGSDPGAGRIYEVHSKHSNGPDVDGYTYMWADGHISSHIYAEEMDADEARTKYLFEHPYHKDPGKVIALKIVAK